MVCMVSKGVYILIVSVMSMVLMLFIAFMYQGVFSVHGVHGVYGVLLPLSISFVLLVVPSIYGVDLKNDF